MASSPGDHMIGASCVSANPQTTDEFSFFAIKSQSPAEDDHATDGFAHQGIVLLTEILRASCECSVRIWRRIQAIKRAARLSAGIEIAARKSKIVRAEGVRSIRFHR